MAEIRLGHGIDGLHASLTNGPGWRVCLWTQGCSLRCTSRCLNPRFLSAEGGWLVAVDRVVAKVREVRGQEPRIEGVTILGGEPLDQAPAVEELLRGVRQFGLSTMVYTGYVYEDLLARGNAAFERLLDAIDVLVDGPYLESECSGEIAWRGSRNQRLLCLSGRYTKEALEAAYAAQGKAFSIQSRPSGTISVSGLQEREPAARLERLLVGGPGRSGIA